MFAREQARVLRRLVDRVAYDGAAGNIQIRLRPGGIRAFAMDNGRKSV